MADNSEARRRTRGQDSRTKRQRATETIDAFEQGGEPVSFPAIARRAGVSVSLLYSDPELASRIATARDRQRHPGHGRAWQLPARSLLTEQSLHAELANTTEQTPQLTDEVTVLPERLARQLGADDLARGHTMRPMLDQLRERCAELEADNHTLRQRVTKPEGELSERTDTRDAARA
jgi:hypothetical protein